MNTQKKTHKFFFLAVATLFTFVLLIHPYRKNDSSLLSDKLLRFRVLADSDSSIDQYEKNELSKKMITLLSPALSDIQTKEEALTLLHESLPFLNAYCNYVLSDYGTQNYASCTLGSHLFPYKTYGKISISSRYIRYTSCDNRKRTRLKLVVPCLSASLLCQ